MTIITLFLISLSSSAHKGFQSLSCKEGLYQLSIAKSEGKYAFNWTANGSPSPKEEIAKFNISDEVDKISSQVLDVYRGSSANYSVTAKRPETKGPQKQVQAVVTHKKTKKKTSFSNCRITF